jgi:hypothetical protein
MNHTSRLLCLVGVFFGVACHESTPAPSPQSSPPPLAAPESAPSAAAPNAAPPSALQNPEFGPHRSPVTVKLLGPEQVSAGQDIEVVAEVDQFVGSNAAVQLHLELPEGAHLVSGNESELLPTGNGKLTRRFVVHLDKVPTTDIEVFATTSSNSFGARAKSAYRFGRPEPRFAEPARAASPLVVSGRNLGTPVQLKANKP